MSQPGNYKYKNCRVNFYYSADPPALSIMTENAREAFWFELEDENQIEALHENLSHYLKRRCRLPREANDPPAQA